VHVTLFLENVMFNNKKRRGSAKLKFRRPSFLCVAKRAVYGLVASMVADRT
jgi:hypothetical protein